MLSKNPSTSTSEPTATPGPTGEASSLWGPMTVKITLATMKKQIQAQRKSQVKQRRNSLNTAARLRKSGGDPSGPASDAEFDMRRIRELDAMLGLLSEAVNEKTTWFMIDLLDPQVQDLGFGLDANGNYPAL